MKFKALIFNAIVGYYPQVSGKAVNFYLSVIYSLIKGGAELAFEAIEQSSFGPSEAQGELVSIRQKRTNQNCLGNVVVLGEQSSSVYVESAKTQLMREN